MVTQDERVKTQVWVDIKRSALEKAKQVADVKRMTFSGFVGLAIENAVEAEDDENRS